MLPGSVGGTTRPAPVWAVFNELYKHHLAWTGLEGNEQTNNIFTIKSDRIFGLESKFPTCEKNSGQRLEISVSCCLGWTVGWFVCLCGMVVYMSVCGAFMCLCVVCLCVCDGLYVYSLYNVYSI